MVEESLMMTDQTLAKRQGDAGDHYYTGFKGTALAFEFNTVCHFGITGERAGSQCYAHTQASLSTHPTPISALISDWIFVEIEELLSIHLTMFLALVMEISKRKEWSVQSAWFVISSPTMLQTDNLICLLAQA